jgi:hypothetical protein
MNATVTLEVTTHLYGLGAERRTPSVYVVLAERRLPARALIAEHVRGEVQRTEQSRTASLALHYMLADDLRASPSPADSVLDVDAEIARAWSGLSERRYMLVVDGVAISDLDTPLALTERSRINFVRLLPLIGG